jgi:hypothetical protein
VAPVLREREPEKKEGIMPAKKTRKRVKDLNLRKAATAKTKGGTGVIEIKDWSFGAESLLGSATAAPGSAPSLGEIKPKGK